MLNAENTIPIHSVKAGVSHSKHASPETRHVAIYDETGESQWAFDIAAVKLVVKLINGTFFNCYYSYRGRRYISPMNAVWIWICSVPHTKHHMDTEDLNKNKILSWSFYLMLVHDSILLIMMCLMVNQIIITWWLNDLSLTLSLSLLLSLSLFM